MGQDRREVVGHAPTGDRLCVEVEDPKRLLAAHVLGICLEELIY